MLTENENFDMLSSCLAGVYGLPPPDSPDSSKEDELLSLQEREVRVSFSRRDSNGIPRLPLNRSLFCRPCTRTRSGHCTIC